MSISSTNSGPAVDDAEIDTTQRIITRLRCGIDHADRLSAWWRSRAVFHSEDTPTQHCPTVVDENCEASHPDRAGVIDPTAMADRWRAEARDAWTLAGTYARRAELLRQARAEAAAHLAELTSTTPPEET